MNKLKPEPNLYIVRRTSTYSDQCPVEGAFQGLAENGIAYTIKPIDWKEGVNGARMIEDRLFYKNLGLEPVWAMKIPDILEFVKQHGDVVISYRYDGFFEIEIYDDYRE